MTRDDALRLALEALEEEAAWLGSTPKGAAAIAALRERLAQPEQELGFAESLANRALPRREWQGLTLEEIFDCTAHITRIQKDDWVATDADLAEFAHVIEAKLKEKNG